METPEERHNDPRWQAVDEGGGGESEGFELAEEQLVEYAEQGEHDEYLDGFPAEGEEDPNRASYGEADEEELED
jgi:hypothetical protein